MKTECHLVLSITHILQLFYLATYLVEKIVFSLVCIESEKKNVLVIHHFDHDIWRLLLLGYNFVCPIFVAYTKDSINVQFNVFLEVQYSLMAYHQWFSPKEMCSFGNLRRIDSPSLMFSWITIAAFWRAEVYY